MTTKFNSLIPVLLFFLVYNYTPSTAQEKTLPLQEKAEPEITYSVTEVPKKIEETTVYLNELNSVILPLPEIVKIETTYVNFKKSIEELKNETDVENLNKHYTRNLKDLKQRWETKRKQVLEWQAVIESRSTRLTQEKNKLERIRSVWKRTYENAKKEKAPLDLLENIRQIRKQLAATSKDLDTRFKTLLSYQSRVAKYNIELSEIVTKIDEALNKRRTKIFTRDSAPIWSVISEPPDTVTISGQLIDMWVLYERSMTDFIKSKSESIVYDIFLLFLLIGFVLGLRHFSRSIESENEAIKFAIKLLERPISVALLVFLIFSSLFYSDAPDVLKSIYKIFMFIPLLRILFHISNPLLKPAMYGLAIIYLLNQVATIAVTDSFLGRIILLLISVLLIAELVWILKKKIIEKVLEEKRTLAFTVTGSKVALLIICIALISNFIGYVSLSELLVSGTINILYISIILVTGYSVLVALTILSLHTKPAKKLRVVENQSEKILQTTRKIIFLAALVLWFTAALRSYNIYDPVIKGLSETINKPWSIGSFTISLGNIIVFVVSIWLAVLVSRTVRFFLEGDVLPRLKLPRGVPGAISSLTTYSILALGIIIALFSIGLDLSKLTILVGALGVGIGFGMQDLVNNFISGLILIFERPIQVGDAVQVADVSGRVKSIGIRSSIIRNWSGAEIIVPNGHLISNKLVNWTMTDQLRRIEIKVGVKYGTDVEKVMKLLLDIAKSHQQVLVKPAPYVLFTEFGDHALNFELRCWTSNYSDWLEIKSDLMVAINTAFAKEGIKIPFPQRDIHIINEEEKSGISKTASQTEDNETAGRKEQSRKNDDDSKNKKND